jgi:hypothetical protein
MLLRSLLLHFGFASAEGGQTSLSIESEIGNYARGLRIFISKYSDGQNTGLVSYGGGNGGRYIQRTADD